MNKDLEGLRRLQDVDTALRRVEKRRREAPERLGEAEEQARQRAAELEADEASTKEYQASIEVQNLELQAQEERCSKLRSQLNTIKSNKEYAAMQHEIAGHEADMSRLEDKILEMMTENDDFEERQRQATERLSEAEAKLKEAKKDVAHELEECNAEAAEMQRKREEIRSGVRKEYLDPYDRLLNRRDGIALVAAKGDVCQGCFMGLTPQTRASLMTSEKPVFCHSCGRMLYLEEET